MTDPMAASKYSRFVYKLRQWSWESSLRLLLFMQVPSLLTFKFRDSHSSKCRLLFVSRYRTSASNYLNIISSWSVLEHNLAIGTRNVDSDKAFLITRSLSLQLTRDLLITDPLINTSAKDRYSWVVSKCIRLKFVIMRRM